jgi:GAF domain-containing protein
VRFSNPWLPDTRSEMALPIISHGEALGAMTIQSVEANAFGDDDIRILEGITDSLAIAIENTRLVQRTNDSLEEVRALNREYFQKAWGQVMDEYASLNYTFDNPDAHTTTAGQVVQLPLSLRDQVIGQITLETNEASLAPEEMEFVDAITTQTALALENARLIEETQRRAVQEQTLNKMTSEFSRAFTIEDILKTALRQMSQLPSVNEISLHLVQPNMAQINEPAPGENNHGDHGGNGKERAS